jgi:hypothetical protein
MTYITEYVYHDGTKFYFDPENYTDDVTKNLSLPYEDGDMVKWIWEEKKMSGVLRQQTYGINLFVIDKVKIIG